MSKVCSKCKVDKPLDSFGKRKASKDGLQHSCKECREVSRKKTYCPDKAANLSLKSKFGMTLEDYDTMLEQQGGCCKVCGTDEPGCGNGRFNVDHNHATGEVRGLLCSGCNKGIGHLKDSPDVLLKAAAYLLEQGYYGD
jgi:hypothetical protein